MPAVAKGASPLGPVSGGKKDNSQPPDPAGKTESVNHPCSLARRRSLLVLEVQFFQLMPSLPFFATH